MKLFMISATQAFPVSMPTEPTSTCER